VGNQHADALLPGKAQQEVIRGELNPNTSGSAGAVVAWDGHGRRKEALDARLALNAEVTAALEVVVKEETEFFKKIAALRKLPVAAFEGAGAQAKRNVDDVFGGFATAAALTPAQSTLQTSFVFKAGTTLLDSSDPNVRAPQAFGRAVFLSQTSKASVAAQQSHGFDPDQARNAREERNFRDKTILPPFVAAHKADLELCDQFGIDGADRVTHQVFVQPEVNPGQSDVSPGAGVPSPAERSAKWREWFTLLHEYIHTLAHPAFVAVSQERKIMIEGFCEMFRKEIAPKLIATAKADGDATLRGGVEGRAADGTLFPFFDPDLVPDYGPGEYARFLQHAEAIRDALGPGGTAAVRAAFFQGHVELIGLKPSGEQAAPHEASEQDQVSVPPVIHSLFALSVMTGAKEETIQAANPKLRPTGPLPPLVHVPGCRHHTVIESIERTPVTGKVRARQVETRTQIGLQNGVTEDALNRANPGRAWAKLKAGDRVLIPVH
jgi:hypothetical protein